MGPDTALLEAQTVVGEVGRPLVGANAYLGADALLPALEDGADVLITGRVADPSLFLAPLRQAFGWDRTTGRRSAPAPWSATSWSAPRRSPAATSPIPATRKCRTSPMWAFRSPRSRPTAAP